MEGVCCMRRLSRRLEAGHHLMAGGRKKGTEKEWALFQDAKKKQCLRRMFWLVSFQEPSH